jgi:hypothetical protein
VSIAPLVSMSTVKPRSQSSRTRSNARFWASGSPPVSSTSGQPMRSASSTSERMDLGEPSRKAYSVSQ